MRVLYVADNRDALNYGSRATSEALAALLLEKHQIVGKITRRQLCLGDLLKSLARSEEEQEKYDSFSFDMSDLDEIIERIIAASETEPEWRAMNLDRYDYDAVVVNGEGSINFRTPPLCDIYYMLIFLYWAKRRGKKAFLVNSMFSDTPGNIRNLNLVALARGVFSLCDFVSVRDPISYQYAEDVIGLKNHQMIPDALFTWESYVDDGIRPSNTRAYMAYKYEGNSRLRGTDLTGGYICVSAGALTAHDPERAKPVFTQLVNRLKEETGCAVVIVQTCGSEWFMIDVAKRTKTTIIPAEIPIIMGLNLLAHSKLYISGRHHPSIMASLGGAPCIFMASNSHKCLSLQYVLKNENPMVFDAWPNEADVETICEKGLQSLRNPPDREKMLTVVHERACEARKLLEWI